uniref:Nucleoporin Nup88 n=1 Tax=Photinus pyralis TaxID=7054 RepID=A0A1Y1L9A3_PHOPY
MSLTDYLKLNKHKLFENLRKSLPASIIKTQNVLTINDGVLFVWDFQDNCVLTLNVKAVHSRNDETVPHQILLPTVSSRFAVELLRANSSNTLLVVAGGSGVLVLELPERCPPHGNFSNNKEIVYCRSHSLDEHLLLSNPSIEVRQVRFHPASPNQTHIMVLTSDNALRLYNIENSSAVALGVYAVGKRPKGVMPGSKAFFLGLFGETAVDFDFGPPEVDDPSSDGVEEESLGKSALDIANEDDGDEESAILRKFKDMKLRGTIIKNTARSLKWPIFLLDGLGSVFVLIISLNDGDTPKVKGPLPTWPSYDQSYTNDACAILCHPSTPPILSIATINGNISHSIVLPFDEKSDQLRRCKSLTSSLDVPDRAIYTFETLELELGLATTDALSDYCCPVFLHMDESRSGHYFATHEAGVHAISIPVVENITQILNGPDDENFMEQLVNEASTVEYVVCTKTATSNKINPVIGFSIYYNPPSMVALLGNGQLISMLLLSFTSLPCTYDFLPEDIENFKSPLKKMLSEPFDVQIYKILKQAASQPILKLNNSENHSQQECYELLQRAAQVFREEHFKYYEKAREEIEKRIKVLQMLKNFQTTEIQKLIKEKQNLQTKAESLAEKYEDIKDKQELLKKRCEKLLIMALQTKSEPSEAEQRFVKELKNAQKKVEMFTTSINKLKNQSKYQEVQMANWQREQSKRESGLASIQSQTIKTNLQDMTDQISAMMSEITEYKKKLGLN